MTARAASEGTDDWEGHWAAFGDAARANPAVGYRTRIVVRALGGLGPGARLVDIGCGEGDLLADLHRRFADVALLGVDISSEGIARAHVLVPSAEFLRTDLLAAPAAAGDRAGWATHAVCSEVLEHLDDPARFLSSALSLVEPGARFVVTVPSGPMSSFDHFIGHRRHFSPGDLRALLVDAGFEVRSVRRAGFPFFNLYRLLVIARGSALVEGAANAGAAAISRPARLVLALFGVLFRFNLPSTPFGWQLVAVADAPAVTRTGWLAPSATPSDPAE